VKLFLTLVWLTGALAAGTAPTNAPARIQLLDQYDVSQTLAFPATNLTLLTIADKTGSEQIAGWVAPVKNRFGRRVDIRGLADLSAVPSVLRPLVRREFRKSQSYPVMLDWSGEVVKAFAYQRDKANVLLLDGQGGILKRWSGPADAAAIQNLCATIDAALATQK
jgi:hypothetical protein